MQNQTKKKKELVCMQNLTTKYHTKVKIYEQDFPFISGQES